MNRNGLITYEELKANLRKATVRGHFAVLGLDIKDAELFFKMLAHSHGKDHVEVKDFVAGCMRCKGTATSLDLQTVAYSMRQLHKSIQHAISVHLTQRLAHT